MHLILSSLSFYHLFFFSVYLLCLIYIKWFLHFSSNFSWTLFPPLLEDMRWKIGSNFKQSGRVPLVPHCGRSSQSTLNPHKAPVPRFILHPVQFTPPNGMNGNERLPTRYNSLEELWAPTIGVRKKLSSAADGGTIRTTEVDYYLARLLRDYSKWWRQADVVAAGGERVSSYVLAGDMCCHLPRM